jgi:cobalamin biosynthesis Co2+ chelatase CbiK
MDTINTPDNADRILDALISEFLEKREFVKLVPRQRDTFVHDVFRRLSIHFPGIPCPKDLDTTLEAFHRAGYPMRTDKHTIYLSYDHRHGSNAVYIGVHHEGLAALKSACIAPYPNTGAELLTIREQTISRIRSFIARMQADNAA